MTVLRAVLFICLLMPLTPATVHAQTLEEQVRQMALEIRELRQELDQVQGELSDISESSLQPRNNAPPSSRSRRQSLAWNPAHIETPR